MSRAPRIAHLGLGAFARSHQAWYTQHSSDDWGIITSHARILGHLEQQGFRYGLITRGPKSDTIETIDSVIGSGRELGDDILDRYPEIAIVTLTVTEAGYLPGATPASELAQGLRARRDQGGGGPITLVPCDNVASNGEALRRAVLAVADSGLASWIDDNVSFVSTMVDRITPAATEDDRVLARELLGWQDSVPVVTEPFTEWVLQGEFPAGRPEWEKAGARFVDDVTPYEQRKLWLLNAAHSLLAYRGLEREHETVFDAWTDGVLAAEVEQLWSEAREVLALPASEVDSWLADLRVRFANPRIRQLLAQVAQGGEQKIPLRIGEVIRRRKEAGLAGGTAGFETIAAYERYRKAHS